MLDYSPWVSYLTYVPHAAFSKLIISNFLAVLNKMEAGTRIDRVTLGSKPSVLPLY